MRPAAKSLGGAVPPQTPTTIGRGGPGSCPYLARNQQNPISATHGSGHAKSLKGAVPTPNTKDQWARGAWFLPLPRKKSAESNKRDPWQRARKES
ncbi:hypothetical protein NDU88_005093 [Pleurodeles waltl]|uniref:Uncharacterized protein n=1 Tax=Pleurodeles waltl TaxID=8319 RepID=A0AAV7TT18_PLEWA|nr:hypothetical protein NDU88_005093 [Pleurodeles waltl]